MNDFLVNDFNFEKRKLVNSSKVDTEYFSFSRQDSIDALCKLIIDAKKDIKIYHKPLNKKDNNQMIINAINNNKNIKVYYYSYFNKDKDIENTKKVLNNRVEIIDKSPDKKMEYHHKEMVIDGKYYIFGSFNFMTNGVIDVKNKFFLLENISIWVKEGK